MDAVGIDVSKGKSIMIALQPMNQLVLKPQEYLHTEVGMEQMALAILGLGEDTRAIMKATSRYHKPVVTALHEYGVHVTVMNCCSSSRAVKNYMGFSPYWSRFFDKNECFLI